MARDTESVVLTPTTQHPQASVTVKGLDPSNAVALNKGGNLIPVEVTAADGMTTQTYGVTVFRGARHDYSAFVARMYEWRNNPEYVNNEGHTYRWDRALLAFGETVADTSMTPLTSAEAQGFADRGSAWARWVSVADALQDIESTRQQWLHQQHQRQQWLQQATSTADTIMGKSIPDNQSPTVSSSLGDVTIASESGTRQVSLSGVFDDGDALTVSATSSNDAVATVSTASDGSSLTVTAEGRGAATITVTADDGNGGTVDDTFTVRVKAAPTVSSSLSDVSGLETGATREVSLSGVFDDADGDSLTITAGSSDEVVATVSVASDGSSLTVAGVSEGTATITVTAQDSDGNNVSDEFEVSVVPEPSGKYAALIAQMYEWRNNPDWVSYKEHTDRWDRTLLAFGETVFDPTLSPMTAAEAQEFVDRGWTRWVEVSAALRDIESGNQQPDDVGSPPIQNDPPPNHAPTVSAALEDITIVSESGTRTVSLSGVFSDADNDSLTVTAVSSTDAVATVSVSSGYSGLTVNAQSRGTATITVTADDGNGGTVDDTFTVRVKAAPVMVSSLADISGLEAGATREVYLSGVFSDGDGDALAVTAGSSNGAVATVTVVSGGSSLTVAGVSEGAATITVTAQDPDGNRASDAFGVSVVRASTPTPTPTPTPSPTPDATSSTLTDVAARYDANGDGSIDLDEYRQAVMDYSAKKITLAELMQVIEAYLASG